jgi:hypothetical protein
MPYRKHKSDCTDCRSRKRGSDIPHDIYDWGDIRQNDWARTGEPGCLPSGLCHSMIMSGIEISLGAQSGVPELFKRLFSLNLKSWSLSLREPPSFDFVSELKLSLTRPLDFVARAVVKEWSINNNDDGGPNTCLSCLIVVCSQTYQFLEPFLYSTDVKYRGILGLISLWIEAGR